MNRYLEKIAREYIEQEHVETGAGNKIGAGIVGALSAGIVSKKLSPMLTNPILNLAQKGKGHTSDEIVSDIEWNTSGPTNTTRRLSQVGGDANTRAIMDMVMQKAGPSYLNTEGMERLRKRLHLGASVADKTVGRLGRLIGMEVPKYEGQFKDRTPFTKNYINYNEAAFKNKDVLLHEIGHAVDFAKGNRKLKAAISPYGRMAATPAAVLAGGMLASEKTRDYAWTVPLLASIPVMREEAAANMNAMKLIKQYGGNSKKFIPLAAANLLGYAAKPILSSGVIAGINHLKRKGEEVNPEEWLRDRE
jgi:hypothetical protein